MWSILEHNVVHRGAQCTFIVSYSWYGAEGSHIILIIVAAVVYRTRGLTHYINNSSSSGLQDKLLGPFSAKRWTATIINRCYISCNTVHSADLFVAALYLPPNIINMQFFIAALYLAPNIVNMQSFIAALPLWFGGLEFSQRLPLCVS